MVNIILGTTNKPVSSSRLTLFFAKHHGYNGFLYIGYPIIGTSEGAFPIDALWISPEKGLVIFNIIEGRNVGNFIEIQDDCANKVEAKLKGHKSLMKGRDLQVPINVVSFGSAVAGFKTDLNDDHVVCTEQTLKGYIDKLSWENSTIYGSLLAVLQSISSIRKGKKKREVKKEDSRGAKLKKLEDSIANLDNLQGQAVIETVEGVQRIRGLAGSGKTIVLALKAAYLHAQHPDWKIAVTFNTRSLKGQFRQLINTFTIEQTNEEPDWDNIQVIHAWGAPGGGDRNGLYYVFSQLHGIEYHDFNSARGQFGSRNEFNGACERALQQIKKSVGIYDAILIDEAQDFPPSFLQICYELTTAKRRLVYAYDELQNLASQALPPPEIIFGKNSDGSPRVKFETQKIGIPHQDIILEKCYRNSRPLLVTAHALGFGIYRDADIEVGTGLVQIFDHTELWLEVGYSVERGELADGLEVTLVRTEESSPKFLESHSETDDLIVFKTFNTPDEQAEWIADEIEKNLNEDELRPDDIVVINPEPLTTRDAVGPLRKLLFERGVNTHLAGVDTTPDVFFDTDKKSIAFTGIFRAKGNEAGMVYIINAHDCFNSFGNLAAVRNRIFTAITRTKAWVRVCGVGVGMSNLEREYKRVKKNLYKLSFRYPTEDERKKINIVNRDMTETEIQKVKKGKKELATLIEDLSAGRLYVEDLGSEQVEKLRNLLEAKRAKKK
ncbi:MAG: DEAD/DEAH box helicase [Deltaproteobacteria bacterium]|nr:DEAD/DEAH box helicase [Deltaproteobacteria bacterium]